MTSPFGTPPVSLPERGDGSRRRRRVDRKRSVGPRRSMVAAGLLVAVVVAAVGWIVVGSLADDGSPGSATVPADDRVAAVAPPSLVVLVDGDGLVYGVTILAPASSAIVHVAPGTMVEVPSIGLASLREASGNGGAELLQQSLENLLGLRFESVFTWDPASLTSIVEPVGDLTVDVSEPVEERTPTGRVTVIIPSGRQTLAPADVPRFLEAVGSGTSLERLVRHQAFWDAYLAALSNISPPGAVPDAVTALVRTDVRHQVLPVEAVSGISGDEELFRVHDDDLVALVERLFPGAAPGGERIRVRILNGVGAPGVAQQVQPLLVDVGGEVTLSGNADRFDYAVTQVVYYDDDQLDAATAIRDALGVGEVVKSLTPLDVVDVTIVVGADFRQAHGG